MRDDLHVDLFQSIIKYRYKQHNTELLVENIMVRSILKEMSFLHTKSEDYISQ